jgi:hypothetical protein
MSFDPTGYLLTPSDGEHLWFLDTRMTVKAGADQTRGAVFGNLALADRGGHDAPGPHDAAAQVGPGRQAEAVEPIGVRGIAAEPGMQAVRPGPAVRAADPGGVLDRQGAGIDLLARQVIASSIST